MLENAWHQTLDGAGLKGPKASLLFQDLCRRYSEAGRAYHNLGHIAAMLHTVACFANEVPDLNAVSLAVWFHDAVYDPRQKDNEEQSAAYASSALKEAGASSRLLLTVETLILATKTHTALPDDRNCQLLLDADLAVLGSSQMAYEEYANAIRAEYAWVAEADYRAGRQKVLQRFLERDQIYSLASLYQTYEKAARENLHTEIERLEQV